MIKIAICDDEAATRTYLSSLIRAQNCLCEITEYARAEDYLLDRREFDLLRCLLENKGRVLTREALLDSVWGFDFVGETNSVDVYIRFLRSKIDEAFGMKLIHTVRGVGYVIREE